jgi:hypothetical protein
LARIATLVHKWLALLVGAQIVLWAVSGFFFTLFPIQQIRSEHLVRSEPPPAIEMGALAPLGGLRSAQGSVPTKLTIERRAEAHVVIAEFAEEPPALFDASTLQRLTPLSAEQARRIAIAHVTLTSLPDATTLVTANTPEYAGRLPAWRVRFPEGGLAVYVTQDTGVVTARRSDLWRLYDALWALHIMDWRGHETFNHPLIIGVAAATLISVIAGVILLPYGIRFCFHRR